MASVSRINGFRPVKTVSGAPYTGKANLYFVPASDASVIMVGDAVKLAGDARAASGAATVTRVAGATDIPLGVVVGILFSGVGNELTNVPPVNDLNTPVYRRASTDRYLLVADDPQLIYEVQYAATSVAAATITSNVGLNGQFTLTAGSTTSGSSGMQLDSVGLAATATLPLKVVGFPSRPDNVPGDTYFSYYVTLNSSTLGSLGTTGV
jgi:Flp pilus assembly secretin CpaC